MDATSIPLEVASVLIQITALGVTVKYLGTRVSKIETKLSNGISEKLARIDERVSVMWDSHNG